jgi:hypothetical protein
MEKQPILKGFDSLGTTFADGKSEMLIIGLMEKKKGEMNVEGA